MCRLQHEVKTLKGVETGKWGEWVDDYRTFFTENYGYNILVQLSD